MQNISPDFDKLKPATDDLDSLCDVNLDPLFWRADRVDALSAWCGHIPLAHWVVSTTRPQTLVELGTHAGVSYSAFCSAVEHNRLDTACYAIDTWRGDQHAGQYGDQVFTELQSYNQSRFAAFSTLIRSTFDEATRHFPDASIDLLHIDGLHTYAAVKHDFEEWLPKLSSRAVVLFHDTNEKQLDFGVWRLWAELKDQYPSFEFLHGHGLGLLATGSDLPASITRLCSLDAKQVATVRNRFAMLGERWEAEQRERWRAVEQEQSAKTVAIKEAERLAELEQERQKIQAAEAALSEANMIVERSVRDRSAVELLLSKADARIRAIENARADLEESLDKALDDAELRAATAENALRAIESSTAWRATRPLRTLLSSAPRYNRNFAAALRTKGLRLAKRLPAALGGRARLQENIRVIEGSTLFDAEWYIQTYPDAAAAAGSPAQHYVLVGGDARHNPGPQFDADWYLKQNPDVAAHSVNPLVHFEKFGRQEGRAIRAVGDAQAPVSVEAFFPTPSSNWAPSQPLPELHDLLAERFAPISPLKIFRVAGEERHVTLITDTVNAGNLVGDARTGLLFAATVAKHLGAGLRVVTRLEPANAALIGKMLKSNHIDWNENIDFVFSSVTNGQEVALGTNDICVTTSWWITHSAAQVIDPRQIIYLIQDDESTLYANGDEQVRCLETMNVPGIRYVVDSKLLFDHLSSIDALHQSIGENGSWFEPAFPTISTKQRPTTEPTTKRQFYFHARPDRLRDLYWRGLETIGACLEEGILKSEDWDIHFVGKDLVPIVLPCNVKPQLHESPSPDEYLRLIGSANIGLCLMDSPHPGYASLDLAVAGAYVVTNRYGVKTSLKHYSENILCADVSIESLKQAIKTAVALEYETKGSTVVGPNRLGDSWFDALSTVVTRLFPQETEARRHV